uniref:Uncharacterized protein n=1 Tax=Nelumbo nucifera TaxID=4432 RepID=A0A822ZN82_NELNU|nr:TPA_asm: hypothetical protein HUJ06_004160 [Nelumbo nucifera]
MARDFYDIIHRLKPVKHGCSACSNKIIFVGVNAFYKLVTEKKKEMFVQINCY